MRQTDRQTGREGGREGGEGDCILTNMIEEMRRSVHARLWDYYQMHQSL